MIKLTKSKKAVQFIDEEGNVFGTSVVAIRNLLNDAIKGDFVLLTRMPYKVSKDRFKESPVYLPDGYMPSKKDQDSLTTNTDVFSKKEQEVRKKKKMFSNLDVL